ncbi:hypothetical protein BH23BAC1_BH23BAC1_17670 [soil metagenome]
MLLNYLLISLRTLARKKTYTAINIIGLAIGMAAFMAIIAYLSHEMSYDKFWPEHENIYRITDKEYHHGEFIDHQASTWLPVAALAKQEFSEIQHATRFIRGSFWSPTYTLWFDVDNKEYEINTEKYLLTDPSFFDVFSFTFIRGNAKAFKAPGNAVITRSKANELFGKEWQHAESGSKYDPIGKVFYSRSSIMESLNISSTATITGIIEDIP